MKYLSNIALLFLTAIFLSGCETVPSNHKTGSADEMYGFKKEYYKIHTPIHDTTCA